MVVAAEMVDWLCMVVDAEMADRLGMGAAVVESRYCMWAVGLDMAEAVAAIAAL